MKGKKKVNERDDKKSSKDGRPHGLPITLTFPKCEIASQVQDANLGQVRRDWLPKVPFENVHKGHAAPRRN